MPLPYQQEFLKSQFSHENIYFWVACERYKQISDVEARRQVALQIYERHLCVGAPEPVNVDSQAQQAAQDGVDQAAVTLFDKVWRWEYVSGGCGGDWGGWGGS